MTTPRGRAFEILRSIMLLDKSIPLTPEEARAILEIHCELRNSNTRLMDVVKKTLEAFRNPETIQYDKEIQSLEIALHWDEKGEQE